MLVSLAIPRGASAQGTERYSLQGFGGWAFGDTNNDNRYGYVASGEGDWNNYYFALNLAAQPMEKLSIRSQAFWGEDQRGQRIKLDYVFAEWAHAPALKLRVGKAPVPFGIYTEVYDVGTVRPFYLLPQFYEGPLGLIPKAYEGVGLTVSDAWEIHTTPSEARSASSPSRRTSSTASIPKPACLVDRRGAAGGRGSWRAALPPGPR